MQIVPKRYHPNSELTLFILLVSLSTFSTDIYTPALPTMVKFFASTSTALQQTLVNYMYGFAVCMLISGILSDHYGSKNVLLMGLSLYFLSSLCACFATTIWQLDILRFLQGLGGCCGTVLARVIIKNKFSSMLVIRMFSHLSSGMAIALIFSPLCGAFLANHFTWRASFIVMTIIGLVLLFSTSLIVKADSKLPVVEFNIRIIFHRYATALSSRDFLFYTLSISLAWSGFFLIIIEYPFLLMQTLQYSLNLFGLILSIIMLGYLIGSAIARRLSLIQISPLNCVFYSLCLMSAASLIGVSSYYVNKQLYAITASAFLYLVGMGILMPNCQFSAVASHKNSSATITSLLYFIEMLTTALISNLVKHFFTPSLLILWLVNFFLIISLLILFIIMMYPKSNVYELYEENSRG